MRGKFLVVALLIQIMSFAQEGASNEKAIAISDWSVLPVTSHDYIKNSSLADFQLLAPDAGLENLPAVPPEDFFYSFRAVYLNPAANASVGLKFYSKSKGSYLALPHVRLGISYARISPIAGRAHSSTETTIDTLVSTQTGQVYYLDSNISQSYWMSYASSALRLDLSFLARLRAEKRFSFYAGVGFSAGVGIASRTLVEHHTFSETNLRIGSQTDYVLGNYQSSEKTNRNRVNFNGSIYVPFGMDFRLGNKSDFGKRAHLFYEMRIGVNFSYIPELRTFRSGNFQQGLGFRFEL